MRTYEFGTESYKKFLNILSILKNEFDDIVIQNDRFSSLNNNGNAIFKISSVIGNENFTITIDSIKTNLSLLKLLANDFVKIYVDDKHRINTFKGDPIEINIRYPTATENQITDGFEKDLKEVTYFLLPETILNKMETASKSLKLDTFSIEIDDDTLVLYMESANSVRKIKFYKVASETEGLKETLSFPVSPLVNFYQLVKEYIDEIVELELTILKDAKDEYYLQTQISESGKTFGLILRTQHSGNLRNIINADEKEEDNEEDESEERVPSYSESSSSDDGSIKIF